MELSATRNFMDMGYEKTGGKCKTKIKNLTVKYRKVKDGNRKSDNSLDSSFAYFMEMDAVHGTRAASEPSLLLCMRTELGLDPD